MMAYCLVVKKIYYEIDVFNDLRSFLSNTQLEVLQLVPPGGQAPLSLTFTPNGAERPKTVYPDLIAFDSTSIYLGELKPRFSKADVEKLMSIKSSKDAFKKICQTLQNKGDSPFPDKPKLVFLLVHTQENAPQFEGIFQLVFQVNNNIIISGTKKASFLKTSNSLNNVIQIVS